jgi:hypothetical protein
VLREISRPFERGDDDRRGAVGLEAAVELAQRFGDVGRAVVVAAEGRPFINALSLSCACALQASATAAAASSGTA